jgi:hypothetical protein
MPIIVRSFVTVVSVIRPWISLSISESPRSDSEIRIIEKRLIHWGHRNRHRRHLFLQRHRPNKGYCATLFFQRHRPNKGYCATLFFQDRGQNDFVTRIIHDTKPLLTSAKFIWKPQTHPDIRLVDALGRFSPR